MPFRKSAYRRAFALKRALASALAIVSLSLAAGGCAGTSGDGLRERPASANYQRLPIR